MGGGVYDPQRTEVMAEMYANGISLQAIGDKYGITRERVRQVLTKRLGFRRESGGCFVAAQRRAEARAAAREVASLKKHGCPYAQYRELRDNRKAMLAFISQRNNAASRDIGWELKLWEWWTIWQESGHWAERGRGQGYVMCRKGDVGPYSKANVFIAKAVVNTSDGARNGGSLPIGVRKCSTGYYATRTLNGERHHRGPYATATQATVAYWEIGGDRPAKAA